jgi:hypothetical protein
MACYLFSYMWVWSKSTRIWTRPVFTVTVCTRPYTQTCTSKAAWYARPHLSPLVRKLARRAALMPVNAVDGHTLFHVLKMALS